ncbi:pyrroloquinoline quinone biosynthesis protein PqqF [Serratia marcescens]|uniref:pyrroloquinoline quinone biosynthesis protein PqqF n=1 Tax=Serratia bockelmannii TaxID=2703793 RepID=UPI0018D916CA|nr:pyrroloquinoline quinone biosynthesis protein PqqF [Serratia marcescens]MBH2815649.1 pyrroloquinoline quinone biosynthesis protein PqqF [Serratia marcescens]HEI9781507.1 pyrroloquinoline quinone biosynthesis protein PqqF [Serratia marcescens]
MALAGASWQLENGLAVKAISDPAVGCAAALVRIEAGSFQAPVAWPGLAHLLEHMLFRGSANFSAQEGLMSWVPSVTGRLNATTQATQTAFFFEVGTEHLAQGLTRLSDMLAAPQLATEAIEQEIEVIDAEYRLLRAEVETRCEAAQRQMFGGLGAMHRFHIGSRAAFGNDISALQQALRQFHQCYFRAPNMTLWLQGPQSLAQLHALAQRYGSRLPSGSAIPHEASPPLTAAKDYTLSLPGTPQLRLVFALSRSHSRGWLRRLERLLLDEAPGGLLARLRAQAWCDAVRLDYSRCSENNALLSFIFTVNHGSAAEAAHIESALLAWLQALQVLTPAQLAHYERLANRDFHRLAPLDQLRARALGLPPVESNDDWPRHIAALISAPRRRLAVRSDGHGETREIQGLPLALGPFAGAALTSAAELFRFFATSAALPSPRLPSGLAPLRHLLPGEAQPVLLLRPTPSSRFSDGQAYGLQAALRTGAAELTHREGHLSFERHQGVWLLQLAGSHALICHGLSEVNRALAVLPPTVLSEAARNLRHTQLKEQSDIAIRRLLAQLPAALSAPTEAAQWHATLIGGDGELKRQLSHLLYDFPYFVAAEPPLPTHQHHCPITLTESGAESALLQFYPLQNDEAEGRWALRVLAQLYAPRYFQRLRVERNVGYVVQCAFHRCADAEGLLFALQSPTFTVEQLRQLTDEFLLQMRHELPHVSAGELAQIQQATQQNLQRLSTESLQRAREIALEDRAAMAAAAPVTLTQLLHWQQRLFQGDDI